MRSTFLILCVILSGLATAQTSDPELNNFFGSFQRVVLDHNQDETIAHLTPTYVKQQLRKMLKNNKEQFLNELFAGADETSGEFTTFRFNDITSFEVLECIADGDNEWDIVLLIGDGKHKAKCDLSLYRYKKGKKFVFGCEGAVG